MSMVHKKLTNIQMQAQVWKSYSNKSSLYFLKTEMEKFFYKTINTCGIYKIGKFVSVYIWQEVFVK